MRRHPYDHRWFAATYDFVAGPMEKRLMSRLRERVVGTAHGRVIEIGAGTGASFASYPPDADVVATEPDWFMLSRARRRLRQAALPNITLIRAAAESLPFAEASFDYAVSTLVLCTAQDVARALAEIHRVLKPQGTFRFIEHVRNDESRLWGRMQDAVTPVWRWFGAGCHLNRRTGAAIEAAGFQLSWTESANAGPGIPLLYGEATRPPARA